VVGGKVVMVTAGARSEYRLEALGYQSGGSLIEVVVVNCVAREVFGSELLVELVTDLAELWSF